MAVKKGKMQTTCPACGECVQAGVSFLEQVAETVRVEAECPHCRAAFEAEAPHECLEWDADCQMEKGRLG